MTTTQAKGKNTSNKKGRTAGKEAKLKTGGLRQNGITRPSGNGKCQFVWDTADKISAELGRPALRNEVLNAVLKERPGSSTAMIGTNYSLWCKFNNTSVAIKKYREAQQKAAAKVDGSMASENDAKKYTSKQMGDACEMLVAAEMTLAGIPALKVPDNWPGYDVIAQPLGEPPQRISVKSRTFKRRAGVEYWINDAFDWLAIVLLPGEKEAQRRIFLIPRDVADREARRNNPTSKAANMRYWFLYEVSEKFTAYENNFSLRR